MQLLGVDTNAKTIKGQKLGYLTGILYLAPTDESGVMNTCSNASPLCSKDCLFTAGRGAFSNVKEARIRKTMLLKSNKANFTNMLIDDINRLVKQAAKKAMTPAVRLNGTSDLPFENFDIMQKFPNIQFYDYTKSLTRMKQFLNGQMPPNYYLTFSRSEINEAEVNEVLKLGGNVAVVFRSPNFPDTWNNYKVVNGDESDLRFLDEKNTIVGLKAKGMAKRRVFSKFVV